MRLAEIKRSPKKIKVAYQWGRSKWGKNLHVFINVRRASRYRGKSIVATRDDYEAHACIKAPWSIKPGTVAKMTSGQYRTTMDRKWAEGRCGTAHGTTPTRAVKKALVDMSRRLK